MSDDYTRKLEAHVDQLQRLNDPLQDRIRKLEDALRDIQTKAVQFKPPRYSWFYDRAEEALKCK